MTFEGIDIRKFDGLVPLRFVHVISVTFTPLNCNVPPVFIEILLVVRLYTLKFSTFKFELEIFSILISLINKLLLEIALKNPVLQ